MNRQVLLGVCGAIYLVIGCATNPSFRGDTTASLPLRYETLEELYPFVLASGCDKIDAIDSEVIEVTGKVTAANPDQVTKSKTKEHWTLHHCGMISHYEVVFSVNGRGDEKIATTKLKRDVL